MECSTNTTILSKSFDMYNKIQIKEEPLHYNDISTKMQETSTPQSETYFEMVPDKSELVVCDTKVDIKQEAWHLNETAYIKSELHEPPISDLEPSLNILMIKSENILKEGIKEEILWQNTSTQFKGISTDTGSQTQEKEREPHKYETSKDMLSFELPRLATKSIYPDGGMFTFLDEEKDVSCYTSVDGNNASQDTSTRQNMSHNCSDVCDCDPFESEQNKDNESTPVYRCETCKTKKMLHSGPKVHKCDVCEKCFTRKSTLQTHKLLHSGLKPYRCDICETCFTQKSALYRHNLLHSGTKPYKCDKCDKCFTRKSSLKTHKFHHTGTKPYQCDICEKYFTQKSDLRTHKLLHSGTRPYKCDICEKCFTRRSRLQTHKLIHAGTTPYKCDVCEKCFSWKSDLQRHALLHSGTKPHKCDVCEKCFTQKSSLLRHALQHQMPKPGK